MLDTQDTESLLQENRQLRARLEELEAISSHRPYRPALGLDVAFEELRRNRGMQYDAQVVDACIKLFQERKYQLSP